MNARVLCALVLMLSLRLPAIAYDEGVEGAGDYGKVSDDELQLRVKQKDPGAIREQQIRLDRSWEDVLKKLAVEPDAPGGRFPRAGLNAKVRLARLGENEYFEEFLVGLSTSSPVWRMECINALGEIGNRRAVRYLIPILDDKRVPGSHFPPYGLAAADALDRILPNANAPYLVDAQGKGPYPVKAWKEWWKRNEARFEK